MDPGISVRPAPGRSSGGKEGPARPTAPTTPAVVQRLADDMRVLLIYHSNAIEGNTLSLYETTMVIEEGMTIFGLLFLEGEALQTSRLGISQRNEYYAY